MKKTYIGAALLCVFALLPSPALAYTNMLSGVAQRIDTCTSSAVKLPAEIQIKVNGAWRTVARATHSERGGYEDSYCGGSQPYDSWGLWTPSVSGTFQIRLWDKVKNRGYPSLDNGAVTLTSGSSGTQSAPKVPSNPYISVPSFAGTGQNMNAVKAWFRTSGFKGQGYFQLEQGYVASETAERLGECHIIRQQPFQGTSVLNAPSTTLYFFTTC